MALPYDLDEDISTLVLGTMRSPGVVKLSGHNRNKDWDVKAAKGQTGASSSLNGDPVGQFEAEFYLAGDDVDSVNGPSDFDVWEDFQRLIESTTNGPTPIALPIYHPDLARNKFTEVTNGGVGGMIHDGKGGAIVKVKFLEYRPPKPKPAAKAQPKPGGDNGAGPTKPDPNAKAKEELRRLREKANEP
jgi:hypothetical protein